MDLKIHLLEYSLLSIGGILFIPLVKNFSARNDTYFKGCITLVVGYVLFELSKCYRPADWVPVFLFSLIFSVPVIICILLKAFNNAKASIELLKNIFPFLFGLLLSFYSCSVIANGAFDKSNVKERHQLAISKYQSGGKGGTSEHIVVTHWIPGQQYWDFKVNDDYFNQTIPNSSVYSIKTKSGMFGFEWVAFYELIK